MGSPQMPPDVLAYQLAHKDEDRGPTVIIISCLLLALCTIAVCARFVARRVLKVKVGWDDWLVIPSLVCSSNLFTSRNI